MVALFVVVLVISLTSVMAVVCHLFRVRLVVSMASVMMLSLVKVELVISVTPVMAKMCICHGCTVISVASGVVVLCHLIKER